MLVFLFMGKQLDYLQQILCYIIYINEKIYDVICNNLYCLFMYLGVIEGIGFCYCFLIEDKIVCFVDKDKY